jgi:hypothetical protein
MSETQHEKLIFDQFFKAKKGKNNNIKKDTSLFGSLFFYEEDSATHVISCV